VTADDIRALTAQLARDPSSLVFLPLAETLRRRGQLESALTVAQQGAARFPEMAGAWDLVARIRSDRGIGGRNGLIGALTRAYFEVTFKAEYEYDYGMRQSMSKVDHLLSPLHLERLFLGRHKYYHFRTWYRDALSNYVQEMLLDPRTLSRPYLQRATVEAMVTGHMKKGENHTGEIHKILSLELIHRLFIDSK